MTEVNLTQISKKFGKSTVLKQIDLTLAGQTIYGLLGRNGAGKSTLLNIIENRIPATSGSVQIDGEDNVNNDLALGKVYLMSEQNLYSNSAKVDQIFRETALFYPGFDFELAHQLTNKFELNENLRFGKLSTGYRAVMKDIIALAVDAEVILLDEPTLGLDAAHRELFYQELMEAYAKRPRIFVISTHLIEEIAGLIEHVLLLKDGKMMLNDTTENLLAQSYAITGPEKQVQEYTAGLNVIGHDSLGKLRSDYVFGELDDQRILPDTVSVEGIDLQKLFINLTNGQWEKERA
ncbi:ABC transporter ATP-binding protein [Ligilactobacillus salitolerans]|uniref:ABC transporter ATP-binding protein n=1 Tax=Ligilactobacillus salitolerans TaxID=1808352 RepID=A0A401IQ52_9LACO|nr:ABC transporter ATP-binding protein [Ligilactobacillus salitolerans]GBG93669.1 ABC transporter ATP-binding protein [Ligilactobacillus salitolerans]